MEVFDAVGRVRPYRIWDGVVARAIRGDRMTFAVVDLEPNVDVREHRHPNEQLGLVLKGSITMTVAGRSRDLKPGETYVIHGDVPHSARSGPEGATVIDAFTPPREDWEKLERDPPGPGNWP